jgi:NADPH:quinone reductase-like Zn-dependent oxidoreductase
MTASMKAVRFHDYGGPEVMKLEEILRPACRDDQVLVRVHAVSVNPVDWKIREGMVRKRVNIPLPAIPGGDLSGVIDQAGGRVGGWSAGRPVIALIGLMGSYAEYVAIDPNF